MSRILDIITSDRADAACIAMVVIPFFLIAAVALFGALLANPIVGAGVGLYAFILRRQEWDFEESAGLTWVKLASR